MFSASSPPRTAWIFLLGFTALGYLGLILGSPRLGPAVQQYLISYSTIFLLYVGALALLLRRPPPMAIVWGGAILFRVLVLSFLSAPVLSDDVYRYIWDGHIANSGENPYAFRVDAPALDPLSTPLRRQVNNAWMASPYLPAGQLVFAAIARVAPQSPMAFQVAMTGFDLLAGWLVVQILRLVGWSPTWALIYLWNPLVILEFAGGAHVDALMIALTLAAVWAALLAVRKAAQQKNAVREARSDASSPAGPQVISGAFLALATLTKGLPALLVFVLWPRWRWRGWAPFLGIGLALALPYLIGPGLGLTGERDGTGMLGAIRIYGYQWSFNGGLYHWLEGLITGIRSEGALTPETPGVGTAKVIMVVVLGLVALLSARAASRVLSPRRAQSTQDMKSRRLQDQSWLRIVWVPFAAYLLLTPTVHPWYVTLAIPGIVFWLARSDDGTSSVEQSQWVGYAFLLWSWSVSLSYLTYLDPANLRERDVVRLAEYVPVFVLLGGALISGIRGRRRSQTQKR